MEAKHLTLMVVNEIEEGKFEIKEFKPYMTYESFVGCILGDAKILRPTGLKDKNDKEIYEGYIVRYFNNEENGIFEVKYDSCKFYGLWIEATFLDISTDLFYLGCSKELEIIGNIYQNPELRVKYEGG